MAQNLADPQELKDRAASGVPLSREEVAEITKAERDIAGQTVKGGPAATAQSLYTKQQDFFTKASNVMSQPVEEITKEEANLVESAETDALGGVPPASGSVSANLQAIADHNEVVGTALPKTTVGDELKEAAAAAASTTAKTRKDGQIPKGSVAAELQSVADQVVNFEEGAYNPTLGDIMKADAAEMQSQTAIETGGVVPKDSGPSKAQSLADRVKNLEHQGLV